VIPGRCHCPQLPEVIYPIPGPLTCACCGEALEIVCPNRCAKALDAFPTANRVGRTITSPRMDPGRRNGG
jgi:hypothetical protein